MTIYLLSLLLAYLIGSIPFGLIVGRLAGIGDIRNVGSGNIGATNMLRAGGKWLGALVLLLDAGKGYAAVAISDILTFDALHHDYIPDISVEAGVAVVLGHVFPVWLKFKGGKGVATAVGVQFALAFWMGAAFLAVWLAAFLPTRLSSAGGVAATLAMPVAGYFLLPRGAHHPHDGSWLLLLPLAALILYKHKDNIRRILKGEEHGFGKPRP